MYMYVREYISMYFQQVKRLKINFFVPTLSNIYMPQYNVHTYIHIYIELFLYYLSYKTEIYQIL